MAIVAFEDTKTELISQQAIKKWSKMLAEQASEPLWFNKFRPEPELISYKRRLLNRIKNKLQDIKFAFGIIFKGKDPYDY